VPEQILKYNDYDNNNLLTSHQLANEIRELYDLPSIPSEEITPSSSTLGIITNLNGFLEDYLSINDLEENSVDVIKECRENIS
jgi:hypothetical protein